MSDYYKGNAIYDELSRVNHNFIWATGNAWLLIYGDKKSNPKVFTLVVGKSWKKQLDIIKALKFISSKTSIPFFLIKFNDEKESSIDKIAFISSIEKKKDIITLDELKNKFINVGLDIKFAKSHKYLNDKESSLYHKWQRNELGYNITVSDVDLIRINKKTGEPTEFIELKRSYIEVDKWFPYSDDFANFNLIYNTIAPSTNINFNILYNQRLTRPSFIDKHNPVSIFSYTPDKPTIIARKISFQNFVDKEY